MLPRAPTSTLDFRPPTSDLASDPDFDLDLSDFGREMSDLRCQISVTDWSRRLRSDVRGPPSRPASRSASPGSKLTVHEFIYGINAVAEALKARGRSFEWVGVFKERHDLVCSG